VSDLMIYKMKDFDSIKDQTVSLMFVKKENEEEVYVPIMHHEINGYYYYDHIYYNVLYNWDSFKDKKIIVIV
jgi:hypothetical protein